MHENDLVTATSTSRNTLSGATARQPRLAANPIAYWLRGDQVDRSIEVLEQAFAELSAIGFTAVKADIPDRMSAPAYTDWLDDFGLAPSLSLFSSPFDETIDIASEIERAKRFGAEQAELGLNRTMVSSMLVPARMATPAVGADFDPGRLALAVDNCGIVCQVLQSQGVRPPHHSHVGGVFETEDEITTLLDTLGPDVIGFGPDTGHLRWAGADPVAMIERYADRIGGIHLTDCYPDHLDAATRPALGYLEVTATRRLWAEPGRGVVDLENVVASLPDDYDGDFMIEIDIPSGNSAAESYAAAFAWAHAARHA